MDTEKNSTKQRIVSTATDLFIERGYANTSLCNIAAAVGVEESDIYNYFESKSEILNMILDFAKRLAADFYASPESLAQLDKNATTENVMGCMNLYFHKDEDRQFIRSFELLLSESYGNIDKTDLIIENMLFWQEEYIAEVLRRLVASGALDDAVDIDFWSKEHVSITCAAIERYVTDDNDANPTFMDNDMDAKLRTMYDSIFERYGRRLEDNL